MPYNKLARTSGPETRCKVCVGGGFVGAIPLKRRSFWSESNNISAFVIGFPRLSRFRIVAAAVFVVLFGCLLFAFCRILLCIICTALVQN